MRLNLDLGIQGGIKTSQRSRNKNRSVRDDGGVRGNEREVNGKNGILGRIMLFFFKSQIAGY